MKKELFEWLKSIIFAAVFVFILQSFVQPTTIYHTSMLPTLKPKEMVIIQKTKKVEKGDIVIFKSDIPFGENGISELPIYRRLFINKDTKKKLIKRVIAGPGDKIVIEGSDVYVNDILLDEQYINNHGYDQIYIEKIPEDEYFLMGDNRQLSLDSRKIGLINIDKFVGKAILRVFPFSRFGKINDF